MKTFGLALSVTLCAAMPASAAVVVYGGNGHGYEFISNAVSYDAALAAASASSYLGQQGYLATVTSAGEQAFIFASVTTASTWFAGSDRAVEGTWVWEAGPETGQIFWVGGAGGSSPTYANWSGGEPNNLGDEDYLWGNWSGSAWNDIAATNLGYVVEYGGLQVSAVPEASTWVMMIAGFGVAGAAARRRRRDRPTAQPA